jgi:glyoxylase-like metal-dependent hydrolase (beta-lactamase superfamily II)
MSFSCGKKGLDINMIIEQMKMGGLDNFSYLIGCEKTRDALVIDPAGDVGQIVKRAVKHQFNIKFILNTHGHRDHTSGNERLKSLTGAKVILHQLDAKRYPNADIFLDKEDTLEVGKIHFQIIHTPGHTPGGICLYTEGNLFTGDTLFVGDSGRTDLAGGHRPTLGASIRKLMELPGSTTVWPGHDYGQTPRSTLAWEKQYNVNAREYRFYREI